LKKYLKAYAFLAPIAVLLVALDQLTKTWIRNNLAFTELLMPWEWLSPYARLVNWHNTGAAFGIFQDMNGVFVVLAFVIIILIVIYFPMIPEDDFFFRLALTLQMAGAAGNLIDRLYRGYVTDFISVGRFPVFNVADSCITMGVVVLLIGMWIEERKSHDESESDYSSEPV